MTFLRTLVFLVALVTTLALSLPAPAASTTLRWSYSADLSYVSGFIVHRGTEPGVYPSATDILILVPVPEPDGTFQVELTLTDTPGVWTYVAVSAFNDDAAATSTERGYVIPVAPIWANVPGVLSWSHPDPTSFTGFTVCLGPTPGDCDEAASQTPWPSDSAGNFLYDLRPFAGRTVYVKVTAFNDYFESEAAPERMVTVPEAPFLLAQAASGSTLTALWYFRRFA